MKNLTLGRKVAMLESAGETPELTGTAQLRENSLLSTSDVYTIYDLQYRSMTLDDWESITPDLTGQVQFWRSKDSFSPDVYSENMNMNKKMNHLIFACVFCVNIIVIFLLFIVGAALTANQKYQSYHRVSIAVAFGVGMLLTAIDYGTAFLAPDLYAKHGIKLGLITSFLILLCPVILGNLSTIGFYVVLLAVALFHSLFTSVGQNHTISLLRYAKSVLAGRKALIVGYYVVVSLFSYFVMKIIFGAWISGWNGVIYVYLLYSYWWTIVTFGNLVFMIESYLTASVIFGVEPKPSVWDAVVRTFSVNLGTAALSGLVLPWMEPFQYIAKCDPVQILLYVERFSGRLARLSYRLASLLKQSTTQVCNKFESDGYVYNRGGMVYCAIFGIPLADGSLRWIEQCTKKYIHLLDEESSIDNLMIFRGINSETVAGCLLNLVGKVMQHVSGAYGFFLTFGLQHTMKSHIRGLKMTVVMCFGENPERTSVYAGDYGHLLFSEYEEIVSRKRDNALRGNTL